MKQILSVLMVLSIAVLSGCETNPSNEYPENKSIEKVIPLTGKGDDQKISYASGVRWNDDYIVTVKHFDGVDKNKICKASRVDLAFVKSPKEKSADLIKWKEPEGSLGVTMVGYTNKTSKIKKVEGVMIPGWFIYGDERKYKLASNLVTHGMSGGPALNPDGDVVGLIVGYTAKPVLVSGKTEEASYSVILPYSSIQEGWQEIQEQIKVGKC